MDNLQRMLDAGWIVKRVSLPNGSCQAMAFSPEHEDYVGAIGRNLIDCIDNLFAAWDTRNIEVQS